MIVSLGWAALGCEEDVCGVRGAAVEGIAVRWGVGRKLAGLGATKGEPRNGSSEDERAPSNDRVDLSS